MSDQQPEQKPDPTTLAHQARMRSLREEIGAGEPMALVPRTVAEVQSLAGMLASSSLVPSAIRDRPADVAMMIMTGAELRMGPASSLRLLYIDRNGIPRLMAGGKSALVRRSRECEYLKPAKGNNAASATWFTKRRGEEEQSYTVTIEDAKNAGLYPGKPESAWQKWTARMLSARAKAFLCDDVYPEVVAGMYEPDEVDDYDDRPAPPTFTAPPVPPGSPNLTVVPDDKPKRARKPKTDTTDASDAEIVDTTATPAKTEAQIKKEQDDAARDAAFAKAREGAAEIEKARQERAANPTDAGHATSTAAPAATNASDDFGDDDAPTSGPTNAKLEIGTDGKPFYSAEPGHDAAANFAKFLSELAAVPAGNAERAGAALDALKVTWVPWSKQIAAGKEYGAQMREAFGKRKTELGL